MAHSRYGSCPSESICEHRHQSQICFHLQKSGYCYEGDRCRMRHPIEFGPNQNQLNHESHFLGHGFRQGIPNGAGGAAVGMPTQNYGHLPSIPEGPIHSPGSPFQAPGEPWSPPYNQYRKFQNRGSGARGGQRQY